MSNTEIWLIAAIFTLEKKSYFDSNTRIVIQELVIQKYKKKATKLRVTFKTCGGKISTYWESWFSRICQNVHLSDVLDRSEVIKIFNLFLYSIDINLFKYALWVKFKLNYA